VAADSRSLSWGEGKAGDRAVLQPLLLWRQVHAVPHPMHLDRKLAGLGWLNAIATGQLVHMLDQNINRHFHVDTVALPAMSPKLFGTAAYTLLGRRPASRIRIFPRNFLVAKVSFPILGIEFVRFHKMLIYLLAMPC
jgi:hypothetical protein